MWMDNTIAGVEGAYCHCLFTSLFARLRTAVSVEWYWNCTGNVLEF